MRNSVFLVLEASNLCLKTWILPKYIQNSRLCQNSRIFHAFLSFLRLLLSFKDFIVLASPSTSPSVKMSWKQYFPQGKMHIINLYLNLLYSVNLSPRDVQPRGDLYVCMGSLLQGYILHRNPGGFVTSAVVLCALFNFFQDYSTIVFP